jgi:moderate conductance mechanosensitive channel
MPTIDVIAAAAWAQSHGLRIVIILVAALLVSWTLRSALAHLERSLGTDSLNGDADRRRRARTVVSVLRGLGRLIIVLAAGLMVLSELGIDTGPLLAGAGILGLALGLGAQTLVRDVIGGIFVLAEEQFHLGDVVRIGEITGTVERMTLRATYLRDLDGALHLIPNGEIRVISNLTRGWARALVDVSIANDRDTGRALSVLEDVCRRAAEDAALGPLLVEPPVVAGVESLNSDSARLRLYARTLPGKQWEAGRALRRLVKDRFDAEGITQGLPRQELYLHSLES